MKVYALRTYNMAYEKELSKKIYNKEDLINYLNLLNLENISDNFDFENNFVFTIPILCGNDMDEYSVKGIEFDANFLDIYLEIKEYDGIANDCETMYLMFLEIPIKHKTKDVCWTD